MKKGNFKNKILAGALALCLMAGLLPMGGTTAHAADTATSSQPMAMGMSGIQNVDKGTAVDSVTNSDQIVMGTHGGNPVYWVMLGDSPLNKGESYITSGTGKMMFAVQSLGESRFCGDSADDLFYINSILYTAMTNLYSTGLGLTNAEKTSITSTTLLETSILGGAEGDLADQHFFPLSLQEYNSSVGGGSTLAKDNSVSFWWLRLSSMADGEVYAVDGTDGQDDMQLYILTYGVRPAFNLNPASVLFTSAAVGGKSSFGGVAAPILGAISGTEPTRWKMTLLDSARSGFSVTGTPTISGNEVTFSYTGATPYNATTAPNEYISVMITTGTAPNETITHYAKVAQPTAANGTASFTIPSNIGGSVNLKIFNEQANGDNKTDYSSPLRDMNVTVTSLSVTNTLTNITSNGAASIALPVSGDYTATLTANAGYVLPQAITVSVGGTPLTSSQYTYTQDTGDLTIPSANITGNIVITAQAEQLRVTGGTGQTVQQGQPISFTSNDGFGGYIDTEVIPSGGTPQQVHSAAGGNNSNASAVNGSITVTLSGTYTATLPVGTHSISINSAGGSATTTFTVVAAPTQSTTATTTPTQSNPAIAPLTGVASPQTSDSASTPLFITLMLVSALGALFVFRTKLLPIRKK